MSDTGDGWSLVDGLLDGPFPRRRRAVPTVTTLGKFDGVTVARLAFRDGDTMTDHSAAWPILIVGQTGRVRVTVSGDTVVVTPGRALSIGARLVHGLTASEDSTVTLLVLHAPVSGSTAEGAGS